MNIDSILNFINVPHYFAFSIRKQEGRRWYCWVDKQEYPLNLYTSISFWKFFFHNSISSAILNPFGSKDLIKLH